VRSGFADGVDHAARGPAILGRVVASEHGEFLNGIHTQVAADHAARAAVAVIVDAETVEPVIVLRGPAAGDGELIPEASVPARSPAFERQLGFDCVDPRGKSGERCPVSAIQWQLEYLLGLNLRA